MENPCFKCKASYDCWLNKFWAHCEKFKDYEKHSEDDHKAQKKVLTNPCINCLGKCVNSDGSIYPCDVGCRARDLYILAKHDQFLEECSESVKRLNAKLDELTVEVKEVTDNCEKLLAKDKSWLRE